MEVTRNSDELISTHSIEEGLDFGCNLLCSALQQQGDTDPVRAQALLRELTQYVSLRYAGELGLFALLPGLCLLAVRGLHQWLMWIPILISAATGISFVLLAYRAPPPVATSTPDPLRWPAQ